MSGGSGKEPAKPVLRLSAASRFLSAVCTAQWLVCWMPVPDRGRYRPMRRILVFAVLALLGVLLSGLESSAATPDWTQIDTRDGLLADTVHCLHTTRSGWVLVGTSRGLNCWDGERLLQYSAGNGLAEGYITAVCDHEGSFWAGSWGGGLSVLLGGGWRTLTSENSPLPGDWISALASAGDGLWIATYGHGLAYLREGCWTTLDRKNSGLPSHLLTCLSLDGSGGLYIGTENRGLAHLAADGTWNTWALPVSDLDQEVTALLVRGDQVWVGTHSGLHVLDPERGEWRPLSEQRAGVGEWIYALASAEPARVWIGSDRGLALWDRGTLSRFDPGDGLPHGVVSALAVDAEGRVWAGTFVRGLVVGGSIQLPRIERLPVVLVHGWRGPQSDELQDSEFWHLARWLRQDGFGAYYAQGISPENTLHTNARRLREAIQQARRDTGAEQVYVLAFSMGGINSRAYLESSLYGGDVRRVFLLGSPHRGEHLWLPLLLWEHLAWTDEPSALELFPAHMSVFNQVHHPNPSLPYVMIAGDASGETLPTLFREIPPSDGLVSTWSALGPDVMPGERRITRDIHAWAEESLLLDLPSLLYPRTTYDAHVRPYLYGVADAPGAGSAGQIREYGAIVTEQRSALRTGELLPGERIALEPFPMDTSGRVRFYVRWKGPAPKVTLQSPRGDHLDPDVAWDDANSEYLELGFADFAGYVLTDTLAGPWIMELSTDEDNTQATKYVAYAAMPDSPIRLSLRADRDWYTIGEAVTLSMLVEDSAPLAATDHCTIRIYSPEKVDVVELARSTHRDRLSRRLYQGVYVPTTAGYHHVLARVTGERGGKAFERGGNLTFGVRGEWARLGSHYLFAKGEPATNRERSITVSVEIIAQRESDYLLSATLSDAEQRQLAAVAHPVHLTRGEHLVDLAFALEQEPAGGDEIYYLGAIHLVDISGAGVLLDSSGDVELSMLSDVRRRPQP